LQVQLAGCSTVRTIDHQVSTFSSFVAQPNRALTYRFERLPSQQMDAASTAALESMVQAALAPYSFVRMDDAQAKVAAYVVQIGARTQLFAPPPSYGPWPGYAGHGYGRRGSFPYPQLPVYVREVSVVIRDAATSAVVYETHAHHDGPWADSEVIFPTMFVAALQGFPTAPAGVRRVDIQIAR
jgi:Domain of unknown function (DUF4136)